MAPSQLEKEILEWFAAVNGSEALRKQCQNVSVLRREHMGQGLFVYLRPSQGIPTLEFNCAPNAPFLSSPLLPHGATIDLWLEGGRLSHLELTALGNVVFPEGVFPFTLVASL